MSGRRDSTCQKHEIPKSLRGTEDADFVWSMITERFPNAAPLLCEMEAVIDRAEDFLQQLKAPCCREMETSTSFCTPDSNSASLISARGSLIENDDVEDIGAGKNVTETQVSEDSIFEGEIDLNCHSRSEYYGSRDQEYLGDQSSDSSTMQYSTPETNANFENSVPSEFQKYSPRTTKEANSLEEWEKVVDNAMRESISDDGNIHVLSNDSKRTEEFINLETRYTREEENRIERNSTDDAHEELSVSLQRENDTDVGDSTIDCNYSASNEGTKGDAINLSLQGSGDESSSRFAGQRTPLDVLEKYAKRCKVPVVYQNITDGPHRHKSNVYVIRGNLGGFAATSRGDSEDAAKNSLAAKILLMVADHQMNDEKLATLMDLSREEMLEIIELDTDSTRETAQRKLYKLCLEKGEIVPKYCIEKIKTYQGFMYVATCTALGYIGEGRGVRECVAKKAAADELYQQYRHDLQSRFKVKILERLLKYS